MVGVPIEINSPSSDLLVEVETSPGSGSFHIDPRLRAESVSRFSDDRIDEAVIAVRLDSGFDAINAVDRYQPDVRVVVRSGKQPDAPGAVLFDGYPQKLISDRDGNPKRRSDELLFEAVGVYSRWAQDARSWIFGRRMRNAAILDAMVLDPVGQAGNSVLVEALPCVFNDNGQPNRSPTPILVNNGGDTSRRIYIFTYEGDPAAESWSLLDALRYLVWFYRLPEGPVLSDGVFDDTASAAGLDPTDVGRFVAPTGLVSRLLVSADDLNCEATNLVEAVALLADRAGVHATCDPHSVDRVVQSTLRVWSPEDGATKALRLAWGGTYANGSARYDEAAVTQRDILEANEVASAKVEWDQGDVVNAPLVVGAVKRWEMTVPLVPGWVPEVNLDNVDPPDRTVAKLLALTPDQVQFAGPDVELSPWYRMYHRNGSEFEENRNVSRLWVLNEDGAFLGATFNRNVPFDAYAPYDFSVVSDERVTTPGRWGRRPRPMKESITLTADGSDFGVHVEVSYDGGLSWFKPIGQLTVLKDRAGIWFGVVNPTSMVEPDTSPAVRNMWYSLIDQLFRVRVTAAFEADERVVSKFSANASHTSIHLSNATLTYKPGLYKFASREGTVDALSLIDSGSQVFEVDDSPELEAVAASIVRNQQEGRVEIEANIPWLDTRFAMGDRIVGMGSRGLRTNGRLAHSLARDADWSVVGKTFVLGESKMETRLLLARRLIEE